MWASWVSPVWIYLVIMWASSIWIYLVIMCELGQSCLDIPSHYVGELGQSCLDLLSHHVRVGSVLFGFT